jgi:hypothetical protein
LKISMLGTLEIPMKKNHGQFVVSYILIDSSHSSYI